MVCFEGDHAILYKLPRSITCNISEPSLVNVTLYKRNIQEYRIALTSLEVRDTVCETETFFFGAKTKKVSLRKVDLSNHDLIDQKNRNYCKDENTRKVLGLPYVQEAKCNYKWPGKSTTIRRSCILKEGYAVASHSGMLFSNLAPVTMCEYSREFCRVNTQALFWKAEDKILEEFTLVGKFSAVIVEKQLFISELGLSFDVTQGKDEVVTNGFKVKIGPAIEKGTQKDLLLSAIEDKLQVFQEEVAGKLKYIMGALKHPVSQISTLCNMIQNLGQMIKLLGRVSPTELMQMLLKTNALMARRISDNLYITWKCILATHVQIRELDTSTCSTQLPITYKLGNATYKGFLSESGRIRNNSIFTSCHGKMVKYYDLNGKILQYTPGSEMVEIKSSAAFLIPTSKTKSFDWINYHLPNNWTFHHEFQDPVSESEAWMDYLEDRLTELEKISPNLEERDTRYGLSFLSVHGTRMGAVFGGITTWVFRVFSIMGLLAYVTMNKERIGNTFILVRNRMSGQTTEDIPVPTDSDTLV